MPRQIDFRMLLCRVKKIDEFNIFRISHRIQSTTEVVGDTLLPPPSFKCHLTRFPPSDSAVVLHIERIKHSVTP